MKVTTHATVNNLDRILKYLKHHPESTKSLISKDCMLTYQRLNKALFFLESKGLIERVKTHHRDCNVYILSAFGEGVIK